jgi:two-component system phosphate regulon sensor histidine kinase PhoR
MKIPKQSNKPLSNAITILAVSIGSVAAISVFVDFSSFDVSGVLFMLAIVCCILIAKNKYDVGVAEQYAQELEQSFAENLSVASKEFYAQLYQNSPIPYLMVDSQGLIRSINLAAKRILGVPRENVDNTNIFDRLDCEKEDHLDLLIQKYKGGLTLSDELVKIKRADGSLIWAMLSIFKFTSDDEQLGLLTLVDITKQKQVENAKTEFVSLASHQLRTPIAAMKWSAELLQMDGPETLNDKQKKYIDRLLVATQRMGVIVDDFLRVSRFELGTFQPEYTKINLTALFADCIKEQLEKATQKNIEVKTFYDASIENIVSDVSLLRMIISNLFSNAIKYTREGGTIHIGFGKKNEDIIISVADNGMGIPIADQPRMFGKLFRATNAVRSVPDGTGLGLYIIKEAILVLHGNITFTSVENNGTTFEVVLPLTLAE